MKKLNIFVAFSLMICMMPMFASACSSNELDTPMYLEVDENYKLTWTAVVGARSYVIEIKDVNGATTETTSRRAYVSLSKLTEGDYEVRVKAIASSGNNADSDWSEVMWLQKEYETGCVYTLVNNSEYELTRVGTASGKIYIKDEYRGKPVTKIAKSAFKGSSRIEEVVISGTNITSIGEKAFYNCSKLVSITIPSSVTSIGPSAFYSCRSLTEVNIPESVEVINDYTFAYCRSLETIDLHDNITYIGESAFSDCTSLKEIEIPDSVTYLGSYAFSANSTMASVTIGSSVEVIGDRAFLGTSSLSEVNFPQDSKLTKIGEYAFSGTAVTNMEVPESVADIGRGAFYDAQNLEKITIHDNVSHMGAFVVNSTKYYENSIGEDGCVYLGDWLVSCTEAVKESTAKIVLSKPEGEEKENNKSLVLKEGVVGIADQVFMEFPVLTTVELPYSVKYIGEFSFCAVPNLYKFVTYDHSVEQIGNYAFYGCPILYNVMLGEDLKRIGDFAFAECTRLDNSSISGGTLIPDSVESVGVDAFYNTKLWGSPENGVIYAGNWVVGITYSIFDYLFSSVLTLRDGTVGIADYAFYKNEYVTQISGLNKVEHIGKGAFYGCSRLGSVTLNRNLKEIEDYTFYNCSSLFEVEIPPRLASIGRSAFYKCTYLNEIDLRKTDVTEISMYAFYGCSDLAKVVIGEKVEKIADSAFYGCASLKEVVIPDCVTELGPRAFSKCQGLESVTIGSGVSEISDYAFYNCSALKEINVPTTVKSVGKYAFYNAKAAEQLTLHEGLESIGDYAFYGLANIKVLDLPNSVTEVGNYAFTNCNGLTSLVLCDNLKYVGAHAFYGCKQITVYTEVENPVSWMERWNSSFRPVVWGCTLSEDNSYVVSVTVKDGTFANVNAKTSITAPEREGFNFVGWATNEGATTAEYAASEIVNAPVGTTLYAIWVAA